VLPLRRNLKRNVLLIVVDELRPDCLGYEGNADVKTPHLDALARQSSLFSNCYCTAPSCAPSRYSLLTGLYVHEHRASTNYSTLAPGLETFATRLRDEGYRTTGIGKMHLTPTYLDVGFQQMILAEQDGPGRFEDDYHRELMQHGLVDSLDIIDQRKEYRDRASQEYWDTFGAEATTLPEEWHSTTWIGDRAAEELSQWSPGSNCAMVSFIKPHHPFDPPQRWLDMYDSEKLTILPGWTEQPLPRDLAKNTGYFPHASLTEPALRRVMAHYYACISHIDEQIGRMIDILKQRGLYDSTLIVFTADHGDYMGFHHLLLKQNHNYEPLARVPLLIKWPNGTHVVARDDLVSLVDLAPTILNSAGVTPPPVMRGVDLKAPTQRDFVFSLAGHDAVMARSSRYKLLRSVRDEQSLFFDLDRDPLEMENLINDPDLHGEITRHRDALRQWWDGSPPVPPHLDLSASQIPNSARNPVIPPAVVEQYFKSKVTSP
jgi:arylsulfatase